MPPRSISQSSEIRTSSPSKAESSLKHRLDRGGRNRDLEVGVIEFAMNLVVIVVCELQLATRVLARDIHSLSDRGGAIEQICSERERRLTLL